MLSSFIIFCKPLGSVDHFYNFIIPTDAVLNKNSIKYLQDNATAVKSGEIAIKKYLFAFKQLSLPRPHSHLLNKILSNFVLLTRELCAVLPLLLGGEWLDLGLVVEEGELHWPRGPRLLRPEQPLVRVSCT